MSAPVLLPHGTFLGRRHHTRQAGDIVLADLTPTVPEDQVSQHTHPEAHLVYVQEGCYVSTAAGAPTVSGPGLLVYNPPGTTHRDRFRGDGGRFFTVSLPAGQLERIGDVLALPDRPVAAGPEARALARQLAARSGARSRAAALDLESLGLALLDEVAGEAGRARGALPPWLHRARALLHDECEADHGLGDVARAVGVHPVYLTRAFRRHFHVTPGDYLRRCRLNRAAALLRAGRTPLAEVSLQCGYYDQPHFSRSFKRAFGLTPREYRVGGAGRPVGLAT